MEIILNCYKVRVTSCCRFYFNVLCAAGVFGSRQLFFMASVVASHTCTEGLFSKFMVDSYTIDYKQWTNHLISYHF